SQWHNAPSARSRGGAGSSPWRYRADRNFPCQSAHPPDATAAVPSQILPSLMSVEQLSIRAGKKPIAPGGFGGWTAPVSARTPLLRGLSAASRGCRQRRSAYAGECHGDALEGASQGASAKRAWQPRTLMVHT